MINMAGYSLKLIIVVALINLCFTSYGFGRDVSFSVNEEDNSEFSYLRNDVNSHIIDSSGLVGTHTSIDLDFNGNPYISYCDHSNGNLKLAKWDGSAWNTESMAN